MSETHTHTQTLHTKLILPGRSQGKTCSNFGYLELFGTMARFDILYYIIFYIYTSICTLSFTQFHDDEFGILSFFSLFRFCPLNTLFRFYCSFWQQHNSSIYNVDSFIPGQDLRSPFFFICKRSHYNWFSLKPKCFWSFALLLLSLSLFPPCPWAGISRESMCQPGCAESLSTYWLAVVLALTH